MKMTQTNLAPRMTLIALALLIALGSSSCFNPFNPLVSHEQGHVTQAPAPDSPQNVLLLFEWCWNNRAIDHYREIFTDDYRFFFAVNDSAGNPYRGTPFTRTDELASALNLFQGGSVHPPATRISLQFDPNLRPVNDSRPNKPAPWYQQVSTTVTLEVTTDEGGYQVTGSALFFVVRGDSAKIPQDLRDRGFQPDAGRWWIDQWQDETVQTGPALTSSARVLALGGEHATPPARATPAPRPVTWGFLKATYRQ